MEKQEAINQLETLKAHCKEMSGEADDIWENDEKALQMAIEAIGAEERLNALTDQVESLVKSQKDFERTIYSMLYQKFDKYRIQVEGIDSRLRKLEPQRGHSHGVNNYESCLRCGKTFYNLDRKLMCPDCEEKVFGKRIEESPNPYHVHRL